MSAGAAQLDEFGDGYLPSPISSGLLRKQLLVAGQSRAYLSQDDKTTDMKSLVRRIRQLRRRGWDAWLVPTVALIAIVLGLIGLAMGFAV